MLHMLFRILVYFNKWHIILMNAIILYLLTIGNNVILSYRMIDRFNIQMQHRGSLQRYLKVTYIGGKVDTWDNYDLDFISYFELIDMVKELGYEKV